MRIASMFVVATIGYVGLSLIPKPINAATIVQNFEITVTTLGQTFAGTPAPGIETAPPIGTKGFGTLIFDESQIQYNDKPQTQMYQFPPRGYYALTPTSYSLDFFNHRYTQVGPYPFNYRGSTAFSFVRTDAGGYQLNGFTFGTQDETSRLSVYGYSGGGGQFFYANAASGFQTLAIGDLQLTHAEEVPEPETIAGVPVALGFGWLFYRKLKRKRDKTSELKL